MFKQTSYHNDSDSALSVLSCSEAVGEVCSGLNGTVPAGVSAVKAADGHGNSVVIVADMIAVCLRKGVKRSAA